MIHLKSPEEMERMRVAGRLTARICGVLAKSVAPGVSTEELDRYADELIRRAGAKSAFLGYRGFPRHICVSVNEEVVHGIPGPRRIQVGDIVSLDIGVAVDGFIGDMATTVVVGVSDPGILRLVSVAEQALKNGIARARAGGRLSDISHAIEQTAVEAGFSTVRQLVGHGIGRAMHEDPQVPNFGPPGRGPRLKPGMTLALEPMVNMGGWAVETASDGWTAVTQDGRPSAHFEHTIAIGEDGAEILTRED